MADRFDNLGPRILQAARMAVAAHLNQGVELTTNRGQRFTIGRAGPQMAAKDSQAIDYAMDGVLPARSAEGAAR